MRTLYAKLSMALLGLLLAVGAFTVFLTLWTSQRYLQEVQQKLHRELADHVAADFLLVQDGRLRDEVLVDVFEKLMVINPDIEVYLLDPEGSILSYSAPPGRVQRSRVSTGPILEFLDGDARLPILGDDPRDPQRQKIFSSTALREQGRLIGYLYIVLASEQVDSAAQMLQGSYILRAATWTVAGSVLLALIGGVVSFGGLTKRLRSLSREVASFESELSAEDGETAERPPSGVDEIEQLTEVYRRMESRIRLQLERLEETDRLRRELIANVSHDVRTPLTHLQGYLETLLLKEESLTAAERHEYLEIAAQQSERLGRLVSDLFELAKLDALTEPVRREVFPVAELVQDVAQEFHLPASERGIALDVDVSGEPGVVAGDLGVLERALENLLTNALQYTRQGDRVDVSVRSLGQTVRVEVRDTGPGISETQLPHIFDRFYRCSTGESEGSGLGLSIAKRALELHGSDLCCESSPGLGSSFWFELPRHPAVRNVTET